MLKKSLFFILLIVVFTNFACSQQLSEQEVINKAKTIHEKAFTLDTHVDIPGATYATPELDPGTENTRLKCNLPFMEKGGLDGVFLAAFVGQRGELDDEGFAVAYKTAIDKFQAIHRLTEQMYPDRCELAVSPDDFLRIAKTGKRAIMVGVENGFPIGMDIKRIKEFYDFGTRYITLCHSGHNQICDSSSNDELLHGGLSEFGVKVIAEMNRLGIMADISHIHKESFWDLIEITKAPIIATHSGAWALNNVDRNLNDKQLEAIKKNNGVVQVVALGSFLKGPSPERQKAAEKIAAELNYKRLSREERNALSEQELSDYMQKSREYRSKSRSLRDQFPGADIKVYVDHIDHIVKVAGINHVGIGTDFDGGGGIPGFNDHSECLNVTIELVRRGYSEEDIYKIWGENLLLVSRDV